MAAYYRTRPDERAAAIITRDPNNAHDANAIRVLIDGVHVGFIPAAEAPDWQPLLKQCERRACSLVGLVSFYGPEGWGIQVTLRDGLPDFVGGASQARKARDQIVNAERYAQEAKEAGDGPAALITPERLEKLMIAFAVDPARLRSGRSVDPLSRRVLKGLDAVYAHAAAMKIEGRAEETHELLDAAIDAQMTLDDLAEAEDADEREDHADNLGSVLDDALDAIRQDLKRQDK